MSGGKHTIVLVQTTASRATRTFHDYEGIGVAMDGAPLPHPARAPRGAAARADCGELARAAGICAMYEQKLKAQNPSHRNITYDISDLFFFVDSLGDLSCLGAPPARAPLCAPAHRCCPQCSTISSGRTSRTARSGSSSGCLRG